MYSFQVAIIIKNIMGKFKSEIKFNPLARK